MTTDAEGSEAHYFGRSPLVASKRSSVTLALADVHLTLATDRGVFSRGAVDAGTHYLLQEAPSPPLTGDLLDLGCGYGPIACVLGRRAPDATVWAIDPNERARALCADNAIANGAPNVRAVDADDVPADVRFEAIWSNPPVRIGKAALHDLLARWLGRLAPTGHAVLVVQKHLGADSLTTWLAERGHPVRRLGSRQGYRLLEVGAAA